MPPKMLQPETGWLPKPRTKVEIQAETDARIAALRKMAHVVSPAEQTAREESAKRKAPKPSKAPKVEAAPKETKAPELVRATLITQAGDERPMSAESGAKLIPIIVGSLKDDSTANRVKLQRGVVLTLWVEKVERDPISGVVCRFSWVIGRKFYATAEAAHMGGKAAIAEDKATRFTVSDEIRRADVLAGDRMPRRDVKDLRPMTSWRYNHNPKDGQWRCRARNDRASFSHG